MNLIILLFYFASIQGFFLSLFLFTHDRGNLQANRWLGAFIGSYSLFLFLLATEQMFYMEFPHLIGLGYPLIFILGPSFYLYVQFYLQKKKSFTKNDFWHFLPFVISTVLSTPFLLADPQSKIELYKSIYIEAEPGLITYTWLLECIHVMAYSIPAFLLMHDSKNKVSSKNGKINRQKIFRWVYKLTIGNLLVWGAYILLYLNFLVFENIDPNSFANILFVLLTSIFIYMIGYTGWRCPEVFSLEEAFPELKKPPSKYERSALTEEQKQYILDRLYKAMKEEKLYMDPDLTLKDLGEAIDVSPNYVSQVINQELNQNFFDFVNLYRVEEACKQLKDPSNDHLSILGIAQQSGFNAKSTFNKFFKKETQSTPSQYRDNNRSDS